MTTIESLAAAPVERWLGEARDLALRNDLRAAETLLRAAIARFADNDEVGIALASVCWQRGEHDDARALLRETLQRQPAHLAAAFTLARIEAEQSDFPAAEEALRRAFTGFSQPSDLALRAAKMLAD